MAFIDKMAAFMHEHLGGSPAFLWIHGPLLYNAIDSCAMELEVCSNLLNILAIVVEFADFYASEACFSLSSHDSCRFE